MVLLFAHRGAHCGDPKKENTLEAIKNALTYTELDLVGVEIDVQLTKDNHLVLHHDPILNDKYIWEQNLKSLPSTVPTLKSALDLIHESSFAVEVVLDLKVTYKIRERYLNIITNFLENYLNHSSRIIIASFDHPIISNLKERLPDFRYAMTQYGRPMPSYLEIILQRGISHIILKYAYICNDIDKVCQELGIRVWIYDLNDKEDLSTYISEYKCVVGAIIDNIHILEIQ